MPSHWHRCQRWRDRGMRCPFRGIEGVEHEQEDSEIFKDPEALATQAQATTKVGIGSTATINVVAGATSRLQQLLKEAPVLNAVATAKAHTIEPGDTLGIGTAATLGALADAIPNVVSVPPRVQGQQNRAITEGRISDSAQTIVTKAVGTTPGRTFPDQELNVTTSFRAQADAAPLGGVLARVPVPGPSLIEEALAGVLAPARALVPPGETALRALYDRGVAIPVTQAVGKRIHSDPQTLLRQDDQSAEGQQKKYTGIPAWVYPALALMAGAGAEQLRRTIVGGTTRTPRPSSDTGSRDNKGRPGGFTQRPSNVGGGRVQGAGLAFDWNERIIELTR